MLEVLAREATFRWAMTLVTWMYPTVVVVGLVGNLLSLWVLLGRNMRRTSACRYLACLAVVDTLVLLASATKTWVRVVWGFELLHVSKISCKLVIFLTHWSLTAAAWLIVAVTLERFLAVWLPLRAVEICNVGRTRVVMVALLSLLALINSHVFWTAELVPVPPSRSLGHSAVMCSSYAYRTLACEVFPWVHLALYSFLPAALLLTFNSLILYRLYQHRLVIGSAQDSMSSRSSSANNGKCSVNTPRSNADNRYHPPPLQTKRDKSQTKLLLLQQQHSTVAGSGRSSQAPPHFHRRLAPMLLGVSFCWLFLTTPQTIYNLAVPRPSNMSEMASQYLVKTICFLLMYTNHAINFFLYCLTGQRFRLQLKRGLMCSESERRRQVKHVLLKCGVANGDRVKSSAQEDVNDIS